jgi:putative ABC transport system permease protein
MFDTLRLAIREHWEILKQDLRFGVRLLRREPAFTGVAILTLALGIGATTCVYAIVDAVVFKPLPFANPDRLVLLEVTEKQRVGMPMPVFSYPQFADVRDQCSAFDGLAGYAGAGGLTKPGGTGTVPALEVSEDLFRVLGVTAASGRLFVASDFVAGAAPVALVGHAAAVTLFGSEESAIGQVLTDEQPGQAPGSRLATIVGVMPAGFTYPYPPPAVPFEAWLPLTPDRTTTSGALPRSYRKWSVAGRLKEGVSLDSAQRELDVIAERLALEYPEAHKNQGLAVRFLKDAAVQDAKLPLLMFLGAVASALLIACVNVASLLMARSSARQREFAVRAALGAGRARIVRQLLTETTLLALTGGVLGVVLACWCIGAFVAISPKLPRLSEAALDGRVLLFAAGVLALSAVASGLVPAVQCSRGSVVDALARAGGTRTGTGTQRPLNVLVIGELTIAMALLVAGGLMAASFLHLLRADLGFDPASAVAVELERETPQRSSPRPGAVTSSAALQQERASGVVVLSTSAKARTASSDELLRRILRIPGVASAGTTTRAPFPFGRGEVDVHIEGKVEQPGEGMMAETVYASPGYFEALRVPLLAGRLFDERDREGAPRVAIVNQTLAHTGWPNENPIGKGVTMGYLPMARVVGVIPDGFHEGPTIAPLPELYLADAQNPYQRMLVIRASGRTAGLASAIEREVRAADSGLKVKQVDVLEDLLWERLRVPRFITAVLGAFSLLAFVLALVGVHGVLGYSVQKRTREIGVRMALGGTRGQVLRLILGQAVRHGVVGLAAGLAGGMALGRVMRAMLFHVGPGDPATLAIVSSLLVVAVVLAALGPALRATRVEPMACLNDE